MMEVFFSYILIFLMCMSVCTVLNETFSLFRCYIKTEEYKVTDKRKLLVWSALSYIITFIICC